MMQGLFVAVQFLTRFNIGGDANLWSEKNCGASVKFFPLVGALLGAAYFAVAELLLWYSVFPRALIAAVMFVLTIILTGGIFFDGFMDSADGVFSGRERQKSLEIMKDSRVGANAVMAFVAVALLETVAIFSLSAAYLPTVLFVVPVIGRFVTVVAIVVFPYARPTGLGKAFHEFAEKKSTLFTATLTTLLCVAPLGIKNVAALATALLIGALFCRRVSEFLGGLTGDVYGAATIIAECAALLFFAAQ